MVCLFSTPKYGTVLRIRDVHFGPEFLHSGYQIWIFPSRILNLDYYQTLKNMIRDVGLGSRIRIFFFPGFMGQKITGSRIRIRNTA